MELSAAMVTQGQAQGSSGVSCSLRASGLPLDCLVLKNVHSDLVPGASIRVHRGAL